MSDLIHMRGLRTRIYIGVHDWEQKAPQDVVLDITIHHDQRAAAKSDALEHTVDYVSLRDKILAHLAASRFALLETAAEQVAALVLEAPGATAVDLTLHKPGALRYADSVAVQIHRP